MVYHLRAMETIAPQIVRCYHCRGMMKVSAKALSVFCPHCQKRVNLENLRIVGTHPGKDLATCGDIVIEHTARLQVPVFGRNVTVHGRVKGAIRALQAIEVGPTGHVIGDIRARKIVVRDGAKIEGKCEILPPEPRPTQPAETGQEPPAEPVVESSAAPPQPIPILRPRPMPMPVRVRTEATESLPVQPE
jgi:cytoskeletal protein CcmA (bactofilin family)